MQTRILSLMLVGVKVATMSPSRGSQNSCDSESNFTMPSDEELDEMFAKVIATMDLPPDKSKVLWGYDRDKKWELIKDQKKVQAKQEPGYYLSKLRSLISNSGKLRQQVASRFQVAKRNKSRPSEKSLVASFKSGTASSTQLLRDLEISLRTNSIDWVREFLSEKNKGLDTLIEFLAFRLTILQHEHMTEQLSNGDNFKQQTASDTAHSKLKGLTEQQSVQQREMLKHEKHFKPNLQQATTKVEADDVHVCIMCLRSIMNNKKGFNMVMEHLSAIKCLALSLNYTSIRTKTLVLELLAAICLVKGGHELIMDAFDNFKFVCNERRRFETLMFYFKNQEKFNVDFMVSCLQFINIIVHSQDDMNYRTHLQYEFTSLALDDYLDKLKQSESDELQLQIQTYLDNRIDVSALAEEAEIKNSALEQVQQLSEKLSISNELQTQLHVNYQTLEARLQDELKKNEGLTSSNQGLLAQLEHQNRLVQKFGSPELRQKSDNYSNLPESRRTTTVATNGTNSSTAAAKIGTEQLSQQPPPPPPPPPPPLSNTAFKPIVPVTPMSTVSCIAPSPPPPPPPPPPLPGGGSAVSGGHKKGMAPQPPGHQPHSSMTTRQLQNSVKADEFQLAPSNINCDMMTLKKTFCTHYKLPTFNWSVLKPNQVRGTIFTEFHDEEKIINSINFEEFEEQFKLGNRPLKPATRTNCDNGGVHVGSTEDADSSLAPGRDAGSLSVSNLNNQAQLKRFKQPEKISFMEHNRLRNMAISLRKLATSTELLTSAVNRLDIVQLSLDNIEILSRMIPNAQEIKAYSEYESQGKPLDALTDEDKFLCQMSKIDRLEQKVKIMFYMKNLDAASNQGSNSLSSSHSISSSTTDSGDPVASVRTKIELVETASRSLRTSEGIRILLEYILVFGNYLNSSSRSLASAPAYGFKLQALDMVTEARSTKDKSKNLLHFIIDTVMKNLSAKERAKFTSGSSEYDAPIHKRFLPLATADSDSMKMPYDLDSLSMDLEQAASISLETLVIEVREFERGLEACKKELQLRCVAAEALMEQQQQHMREANLAQAKRVHLTVIHSNDSHISIRNPTDEGITRLQKFIKARSGEIAEVRDMVERTQKEFSDCAQYFGENSRTIESSSLFSIFLRLLKNIRQCQLDNKLAEKRKFDEELRKQIQQQQALRTQKKRQNILDTHNNNERSADKQQQWHHQATRNNPELLHQDEVSHGTLDILITGLKVEPYRRLDGSRKSMRRLDRPARLD